MPNNLPNRRFFKSNLQQVITQNGYEIYGQMEGCYLLNLDVFKNIMTPWGNIWGMPFVEGASVLFQCSRLKRDTAVRILVALNSFCDTML